MSRIARDRHIKLGNDYTLVIEPLKRCQRVWRVYRGLDCYGSVVSGVAGLQDDVKALALSALNKVIAK